MAVNIDKELFPENTGGAVPTYDAEGNIESVEKLDGELTWRTGITTQEGFRKALKDADQDIPYYATPETLRAAFTEINGGGFPEPENPEIVTFGVINGVVGEISNEGEAGEKYTLTVDYNGAVVAETGEGTETKEVSAGTYELDVPEEGYLQIPPKKYWGGWTLVKDDDSEFVDSIEIEGDTTIYAYWYTETN